jgi:hypothetical protein
MSLLLQTQIDELVNKHIQGKIARVGGRMGQLINYRNCKVTDINVIDGGYGKVQKKFDFKSVSNLFKGAKQQFRQEVFWLLKGESEMRDRKTIVLDMHFALQNNHLKQRFDGSISSNVLEHSPNPIFLLLNFHFITKENGYQFHAIPNYRYTFDQFRKPTTLEHFIEDFEKKTWFNDTTHTEDYIMSAIEKHGWQKLFHEKYPVSYPFMHFHVFDENNVKEIAAFMFEDVVVDVIKNEKYSDNVLFFRNKLKLTFRERYSSLIDAYQQITDKNNKV